MIELDTPAAPGLQQKPPAAQPVGEEAIDFLPELTWPDDRRLRGIGMES